MKTIDGDRNKSETATEVEEKAKANGWDCSSQLFDSGAYMIDLKKGSYVYCIQLYDDVLGFSDMTNDVGFDSVPTEIFRSKEEFVSRLDDALKK